MNRNKRFHNMGNVKNKRTWDHFVRWQKSRRTHEKDYSYVVPLVDQVESSFLQSNREECSITWIGHATFLIQSGGLNIITDPVWAMRMGFHNRLTNPGIPIEDVPAIDIVLISHSHYDHLHYRSIRELKGNPLYFVPEGLGVKFSEKGLVPVEEFTWWQEKKVNQVSFTFVPAQHWSKRTPWDTNTSHWGGWVVKDLKSDHSIYFSGDSGYFSGFKEIGEHFKINQAILPIGAYEPEWFMAMQHVSPEEAVQAFLDLNAQEFIPMHFSTFRLADDTPLEALLRLEAEWKIIGLEKEKLKILKLGETYRPKIGKDETCE